MVTEKIDEAIRNMKLNFRHDNNIERVIREKIAEFNDKNEKNYEKQNTLQMSVNLSAVLE